MPLIYVSFISFSFLSFFFYLLLIIMIHLSSSSISIFCVYISFLKPSSILYPFCCCCCAQILRQKRSRCCHPLSLKHMNWVMIWQNILHSLARQIVVWILSQVRNEVQYDLVYHMKRNWRISIYLPHNWCNYFHTFHL